MDPDLRQRIINEAYKLFISKGIKHTSFCDIALAVNKSKGAVMHYFPSKSQLVNIVIENCFFPSSQLSPEMKLLADKEWGNLFRITKILLNGQFIISQENRINLAYFIICNSYLRQTNI